MVRGRGELTPSEIRVKNEISKRLNFLLHEKNKKQIDIHKATGIPKSTLTGYFKGTSIPNPGNIQKLADFFNVKKSFIDPRFSSSLQENNIASLEAVYNKLNSERQAKVYDFAKHQLDEQTRAQTNNKVIVMMPTKSKTINIAGELSAGGGTFNYKTVGDIARVGTAPSNYDLAFKIVGDSMHPTFRDGEIVFVKETNDVYDGQIGAVEIDNVAFIKKMYFEKNRLRLVSLNTDVDENGNRIYPDFYADELDDIYIIGRVII